MTFTFTIEGRPQAKQRPRVVRGHTYTPKETLEFERKVRTAYLDQGGIYFGEQPLEANIRFIFPIAKSWSKKKKQDAIEGKTKMVARPDLDNLVKSILDSLNGVSYKDDGQVINIVATKEYGIKEQTIVWLKSV